MANSVVTAAMLSLLAAALTACAGTAPPAPSLRAGELSGGTAKVSIDGRPAVDTEAVSCRPAGSQTAITTGNDDSGTVSTIDSADGLSALSIELRNVDGFTGSYWQGLGEAPEVTLVDRTYLIKGTAEGVSSENPSAHVSARYSIQVAC